MSFLGKSFLSSEQLTTADVEALFSRTQMFKDEFKNKGRIDHLFDSNAVTGLVLTMVFSEPSTRTRLSFQTASYRLGLNPITLDRMSTSSISKGETFEDTLRNVGAMCPDVLVVRYGVDAGADEVIQGFKFPVINGGIGAKEHPTQALLDAFTIRENRGQIKGEKMLIVGDVLHSRVANSNLVLLKKLGAEVGYCAPEEFAPDDERWRDARHFKDLKDGISWATAVMGLRIQKERHLDQENIGLSIAEYREKYRIGGNQLKNLLSDGILLHPGPVIRGVEFSDKVLKDPRCKVLDQVTNGVFVRAALLSMILGIEVHK